MKILLYGGSFDPPHNGHLNNLRAAAARVRPDRVVVMPAGTSPFKQGTNASGALRLEMCGCFHALAGEPGSTVPQLEVSSWEIEQAEAGHRNYTVLTVEKLAREAPGAQLYLAIGSDMLLSFDGWYRWQDILPAVPAVKAQQHIAADGKVQLRTGGFPGQLFHREHRIIAVPGFGLFDLPAADLQLRDGAARFPGQSVEAPAHFQPQRPGGVRALLEGRCACRHHHHPVRPDAGGGGTQVVQVAVVGRVEAAAVEKDLHLTSAGRRRRCPFSSAGRARTWSRSPAHNRHRWPRPA